MISRSVQPAELPSVPGVHGLRGGRPPPDSASPRVIPATTSGRFVGMALGGQVAALLATWLTTRSTVLAAPVANGVYRGLVVASWIGVGLVTWRLRPLSRLGPLFVAAGFLYSLTTALASADPTLFTLGRVAWACLVVLLSYILLAFPRDRLERGAATWMFRVALAGTVLLWVPLVVGARQLPIGAILTRCDGGCPENGLRVADLGGTAGSALSRTSALLTSAILLAVAVLLLRRLRAVSGMARNTLLPALLCLFVWALAIGVSNTMRSTQGDGPTALALGWVGLGAALLVPYALLAGQVRGRLFAGTALHDALPRLAGLDGRSDLRPLLADVLRDPSLELFLWAPSASVYVDGDGRRVSLKELGDRSLTEIRRRGERVALIVHDPVLDETPGLVDAIAAGALLAIENAGLEDELRAAAEELRASRARIVSAGAEERRRIERDLHDSAQNRLVALRVKLGLAEERAAESGADELHRTLGALGDEAQEALESVRTIAHGIYPPLLAVRGIGDALAAEMDGAGIPVRIVGGRDIARSTADAEAAVYFCCLEAVQNAAKHAGAGARVTIRVRADRERVAFSVEDDGAGFEPRVQGAGAGLANMRDRIAAVGGGLDLTSAPGAGTTVSGTVPWPARPRSSPR